MVVDSWQPTFPPYDHRGTATEERAAAVAREVAENAAASGWPDAAPTGSTRVVFADLVSRQELELEFDDADLAVLSAETARRGVHHGAGNPPVDDGEVSPLGMSPQTWSYGIDNRVKKAIGPSYPIRSPLIQAIGTIGDRCTGTLIGRRLVLTAAHCVVASDGSQPTVSFRARRSGSSQPFGNQTSLGFFWDSAWSANNCPVVHTEVCKQHDWALVVLSSNAWASSPNGTPAWMGYGTPTDTYIASNNVLLHDGYPICDSGVPDKPAGCTALTLYGDPQYTNAAGFNYYESPNRAKYFRTGSDISPGQSGGPAYGLWPDVPGLFLQGILVFGEVCRGAACATAVGIDKTHPAGMRGITNFVFGFINNQQVAYP
jgi:V8-like Glu-specific endopeptidase